jgi:organic hydroperoxide reductase OsmC/OhrA
VHVHARLPGFRQSLFCHVRRELASLNQEEQGLMQNFPHVYTVRSVTAIEGDVQLLAPGLPPLSTETPAEFDGPGDRWSPETLFVGSVIDCFALTFRGVARASKLPWSAMHCEASGTLDRVDSVTQFTDLDLRVQVEVPAGVDLERARRVVEKAERNCLIANSLKTRMHFDNDVEVASSGPVLATA